MWRRAGVEAVKQVQNPQRPAESAAAAPPPEQLKAQCLVCHEDDVIRQQRLTRAQWDRELNKMSGWTPASQQLSPTDRLTILDYLSGSFGPRR